MFRNKKLFKEFISCVKTHKYTTKEASEKIKALPIKVLRKVGKEIIYTDYDGYNYASISSKLAYFDNLDRWQKEIFIKERLYKLCA